MMSSVFLSLITIHNNTIIVFGNRAMDQYSHADSGTPADTLALQLRSLSPNRMLLLTKLGIFAGF